MNCIVDDIFLWSEDKGLLNEKYKDSDIDIKALSKGLKSDEVAQELDNIIDCLIVNVLSIKARVETKEKAKKFIRAYLLETEIKGNE